MPRQKPRNQNRIDLDPDFRLEDVRSQLVFPHEAHREYGLSPSLQNDLYDADLLPIYKLGSRSVLYRADIEKLIASLPLREPGPSGNVAAVEAELTSVLKVIRLVRQARRHPVGCPPQTAAEAA
jgi:hypothetical protein